MSRESLPKARFHRGLFDPPECLVDLSEALANAAYEFIGPAERLAELIEAAQADGMDPVPLTRIAMYMRVAMRCLNRAREAGFAAADTAADELNDAYDRYIEGETL